MGELSVFEFRSPALVRVGRGALSKLPEDARAAGMKRALLVTDGNLAKTGYPEQISAACRQVGVEVAVFPSADGEPTTVHVEQGLEAYRRFDADGLIAIGGGSVIDTAKAVAVMSTNPGHIVDYTAPGSIVADRAPLICAPTTAGTGSEVTRFCVITDPDTQAKIVIGDPRLIPDVAIDDPQLTDSCPPPVTSASGIDALTHAIESYVCRRSTALSAPWALSAIRHIAANLQRAYDDGSDTEARDGMMVGQLEAGMALSNSSVGLVHGMARPLGVYFHLPHGFANGLLLPTVMAWSLEGAPHLYADVARAMNPELGQMSDEAAAKAGAQAVDDLCRDLGGPTLGQAVGGDDKIRAIAGQMAKDALVSGSPANNPRLATEAEIVALYDAALLPRS